MEGVASLLYLRSFGIKLRFSCSHTSQHNGLVRRDHSHIEEKWVFPSSSSPKPIMNNSNEAHQMAVPMSNKRYLPLLLLNYAFLFVGSLSSSLLSKYYFIPKGSSIWVSTWVQSAGFPLIIIPILLPYYLFKSTERKPFARFTPKLLVLSIFLGFMLGLNNLLFSWKNSYLPVSNSSLLLSSQLVFNVILSVIIVKQKITFMNLSCVILLTLSSVLLALESSNNKPHGLIRAKYFIGYFSTIGAGLLFALYLPIMEMVYKKAYCYAMVMEMQLVIIGMVFDGGFVEMKREGSGVFDKGERVYWLTVASNVVSWQLCFMGTAGVVFLTCSLTGGICMTALLMMNVVGGVVAYGDEFGGVKAVSTVMCGWGFCSYVYGMYAKNKMIKYLNPDSYITEIIDIRPDILIHDHHQQGRSNEF